MAEGNSEWFEAPRATRPGHARPSGDGLHDRGPCGSPRKWPSIQVQVEGWTEAALIMAAWSAPINDGGPRPSEHPKRSEVVYVIAFARGQQREAFKAPIIRMNGREPRLGRWFRLPDALEGKGMEAMQAAVDGDLALPDVEELVQTK